MTVSAKEVQELRKMSGAGMMECKSALSEANGNLDDAFKLLREKGIAKAEKKSSRDANEGLVAIKKEGNSAAMIEVNSETDFVSRNSEFHSFFDPRFLTPRRLHRKTRLVTGHSSTLARDLKNDEDDNNRKASGQCAGSWPLSSWDSACHPGVTWRTPLVRNPFRLASAQDLGILNNAYPTQDPGP